MISIIFSNRNRANILKKALSSLEQYRHRNDIEIVCLDDGSTDGSDRILKDFADSWSAVKLIKPLRKKGDPYYGCQGKNYNYLINHTKGDKIIIQCAEVYHCEDIITALDRYCEDGSTVMTTTINFNLMKINIDCNDRELLDKIKDVEPAQMPLKKIIRKENRIIVNPPSGLGITYCTRAMEHKGEIYNIGYYGGYLRPIPLFFCGMITRNDFNKLGPYPTQVPADVIFAKKICAVNKVVLIKYLVIHITHPKY